MQWCLGMYASASTWLFNVVREVTGAVSGATVVTGRFADSAAAIPTLDPGAPGLVIKTHDTDAALDAWLAQHATHLWISIRDPRDCVASLMLYMEYPFDEALEVVGRSARHCRMRMADPRAVLFRYEDGFTDEPATMDRIAAALGGSLTESDRRRLFEATRRPRVEAEIARRVAAPGAMLIGPDHWMDPATQWHNHHINRTGEIGRWRHQLDHEQVQAIEAELADWMDDSGYVRETAQPPVAGDVPLGAPMIVSADGPGLGTAARDAILRVAAAILGRGPLIVVAVSDDYAVFLDNWLRHMERLHISRILVVAMDPALERRLAGSGLHVAPCRFDGSEKDFRLQRSFVWACLSDGGYDIVQSDIDAIWLRSPVPRFLTDPRFDVVFTQGTFHPIPVWEQWGFVLCTGLFSARAGAATRAFFAELCRRADRMRVTDDQETINTMLLELGVTWRTDQVRAGQVQVLDDRMTVYHDVLVGHCPALDLRIAMLPHHLFPRVPTPGDGPYVKHVLRPEDAAARIQELRDCGCWLVPDARSA